MKTSIVILSLTSILGLVACEKPTVVNVPADTVVLPSEPGTAGPAGETGATGATGAAGSPGSTGAPGSDATIVIPPPVADMPAEIVPDPTTTPAPTDSTTPPPAN